MLKNNLIKILALIITIILLARNVEIFLNNKHKIIALLKDTKFKREIKKNLETCGKLKVKG